VRGGDWDRVMKSVRTFRAEKPQAFLHSQFTAGTYNIDGLSKFVQVVADLGFQEAIMRWVQCHTEAREDVSLRWHKSRTLKAVEEAQELADKLGVSFTAEDRPFSEIEDSETIELPSVLTRLRRYLDFQTFGGGGGSGTCPSTSTCIHVDTPVLMFDGQYKRARDIRSGDVLFTHSSDWVDAAEIVTSAHTIHLEPCYRLSYFHEEDGQNKFGCLVCTDSHELMAYPQWPWPYIGLPAVKMTVQELIRCGAALVGKHGLKITIDKADTIGRRDVVQISLEGPNHVYFANGVWHHNKSSPASIEMVGGASPVIIRSPVVRRSPVEKRPGQAEVVRVPINYARAALIAAADGKLWSCFAQHAVGDAMAQDMAAVICDPRYQAFLQNRQSERGIMSDKFCRDCPRVF